ncbi:MAG: nucleoside-diphosphate sugar epimerase [Candidatus Thermofonsia Clade 1 bacterium]|jgi:dihydroflavonol-4-reductase|uniref:Nucleoside-diphosphate sugar epimerase n=1 Tax=Candidatus Thermofonsia Clade 1 bacterium TaxID=2364210 RepID=A0A2M8PEE8_9CHLR|nr:MAG: nucleoside-diphosphate sugar epimerase [Candidatus Thermofonsia Clade 1 bacterium]
MHEMVKALVTGGTGFLGAHIVRLLVAAGHEVRLLRRASSRLDLIADLPVEHALGDVTDADSLHKAAAGCAWIFHTAAIADYWRAQRAKMYQVNVEGTRNVLRAAQAAQAERVIFTSSAAAVGLRPDGAPSDETVAFNLPPERFPYGHSKMLAEQEVAKAVQAGLPVVTLNPSVIFGPGDLNLISGSLIVEPARGLVPPFYPAGAVTAIDVRDVAAAHLAAAERGAIGERYILGAQDATYRELFAMICQIVGVRAPKLPLPRALATPLAYLVGALSRLGLKLPVNADQIWLSARRVLFNSSKARAAFGEPRISLRQSLEDTYQWYLQHGLIAKKARA